MSYKINDQLDIDHWAREYNIDMRCRVSNIFAPESAQVMASDLIKYTDFKKAHIANNQYREISKEEFNRLEMSQRQALVREVYGLAAKGIGFWYGRYGLKQEAEDPLKDIYQWLNSGKILDIVREITGIMTLGAISAQITSFSPGDFLTRHRDDVTAEKRKVAFVLNLTEQWHPDWGGLLQFFQDNGDTRGSWSPMYNSLCLFDVKHVHSVTCIAPFAPKPRLAISGWFHEKAKT